MKRVEVDAGALREVLQALIGPDYRIRELQATRSLERLGTEFRNPINVLIREFDAAWQTSLAYRTNAVYPFESERAPGDGPFPPPSLELVTGSFRGCLLRLRSAVMGQEQVVELSGEALEGLSRDLLAMAASPARQDERKASAGLLINSEPDGAQGKVVHLWVAPMRGDHSPVARLSVNTVRALAAQLQQVAQRDAPKPATAAPSEMSLGG